MDVKIVQELLEAIFAEEDYDLFKALKYGEEEEHDQFPEIAESFVASYDVMSSIRSKG